MNLCKGKEYIERTSSNRCKDLHVPSAKARRCSLVLSSLPIVASSAETSFSTVAAFARRLRKFWFSWPNLFALTTACCLKRRDDRFNKIDA